MECAFVNWPAFAKLPAVDAVPVKMPRSNAEGENSFLNIAAGTVHWYPVLRVWPIRWMENGHQFAFAAFQSPFTVCPEIHESHHC